MAESSSGPPRKWQVISEQTRTSSLRRRREPKVGIKAYDSVNLAYRYAKTEGDLVQLIGWEIAELALNGP